MATRTPHSGEAVYFNEAHNTGALKTIEINGKEITVHDSGNFQAIFESYVRLANGMEPDPYEEPGKWAYSRRLSTGNGPQIVAALKEFSLTDPEHFELMRKMAEQREKERAFTNPDQAVRRDLINSIAVDRLGDIIMRRGLEVTLVEICS
jgi:hypothetical protein